MTRAHRPKAGFWIRLCVVIIYPLVGVFFKIRWHHLDRMPARGGVLVAVNHISQADTTTMARLIWQSGRIPRFLIKSGVFGWPVIGRMMTGAGQIPVYRDSAQAADAFRDAVAAVERGECVGVYPEGTITRDPDLWPMTGKTGAARIALMTGCPVIPVANWGAQDILRSYTGKVRFRLLPRKTLQVRAGKPVDLSAFEGKPPTNQLLHEATEVIMARVAETLGELRGETPPKELYDLRKARKAQGSTDSSTDSEEKA
jgi:1-acyl-sn-glycerol-3-phosphate acyltransferase